MAYAALVTEHIREGKRILSKLDELRFKIYAAFWWYDQEEDQWKLIISTNLVSEIGPRAAYGLIFEKIKTSTFVKRSDIMLVPTHDFRVRLLKSYFDRSSLLLSDTGAQIVSGHTIDGAYPYRLNGITLPDTEKQTL